MRFFDKPLSDGMCKKIHQPIIVLAHVQQTTRLLVHSELRPSHNFKELFDGAESAGQSNKAIGKLRHQCFPLVHRAYHPQVSQPCVCNFFYERSGDYTGDAAAFFENGIGDFTHHANACAAIDETYFPICKSAPQLSGGLDIFRP